MSVSKLFYVEHGVPGGDLVEFEYEVKVDAYEPYVPAKISGPPENCYPAEGGFATVDGNTIRRRRSDSDKAPWETVPYSVFLEGLALSRGFRDEPGNTPYHKTALEQAEAYVENELLEACEEDRRDRYEAAMEARADAQAEMRAEERDRGWDFGGDF